MKKRIISILLALSMTVSAGAAVLAAPSHTVCTEDNGGRYGKGGQGYRSV